MATLFNEVVARALKRPWLLAVPLLGLLGQNVGFLLSPPGPAGMAVRAAFGALMTVAITTVFAELWLGDGLKVEPARFLESGKLYLIPYPLLLLYGGLSTPLVYWILHADVPQSAAMGALYFVVALGKLSALALGAVSSVAVARRSEASGTIAALRLGFATVGRSAGFFAPALIGVWVVQEASVYLTGQLAPGLLGAFVSTAVPLVGCVALPIEAWRAGRLTA